VLPVARLDDLMRVIASTEDPALAAYAGPVAAYRERYGV
jgi:hypothetical protein